jgi:hypothetical protein
VATMERSSASSPQRAAEIGAAAAGDTDHPPARPEPHEWGEGRSRDASPEARPRSESCTRESRHHRSAARPCAVWCPPHHSFCANPNNLRQITARTRGETRQWLVARSRTVARTITLVASRRGCARARRCANDAAKMSPSTW